MTWKQLLADGEVRRHKTAEKELDSLRAVIIRDLVDASLDGLSADRRFATAYNAALQAAKMAIACAAIVSLALGTIGFLWKPLSGRLGKLPIRTAIISTDVGASGT